MADLLSILSGAQTSLAAQRAAAATASHNIDNANTAGYARQRADIVTLTPADLANGSYIGRGATLGTVTQARDRFLEAQIPQILGDSARSSAESSALQAFHGLDPDAAGSLGSALSGFYSALRTLSQNPGDMGLRSAFLGSASVLAQTFNRTSQSIEAARAGLDARAEGLTGEINTEAAAVAQLNGQIHAARASGGEPNDLLDLRQKHLDELARLAGATQVPTSDGDVNVMLPGGVAIVSGTRAGALSVLPDATNDGHVQIMAKQTDGSGPTALANGALGGELGGSLAARDGALATARADVDQLAYDLASKLNTAHEQGYGLDGSTNRALFDVGAPSGAARRMTLLLTDATQVAAAASAQTVPGDATNAQALLATESAALSGGSDAQATLSTAISRFGSSSATAKAFSEQDAAMRDQLVALRDSYSGVSIDEEMIAMQRAQRSYEAIAKVIQTADQMMETLMNLR